MRNIVWLASYPKSGNTWFRIFLTNLLRDLDKPVTINNLDGGPIASSRIIFDVNVGLESSDLTADEIDRLRPELYAHLAEHAKETLYMKIHDAYSYTDEGTPLIPQAATGGALYFIRNPLDVAVSFTHHNGSNYNLTISQMAENHFAVCHKYDRLHKQLRQKLLSWSGHVRSWVDCAPFPVCVLRYEDMKTAPLETFEKAVRFAGLSHSRELIQKAIDFSSFDVLQKQEESGGFHEKSPVSVRFFRKGEIGSWRDELTAEQAQRIVRDHREVMQRFGYVNEQGEITC